MHSKNLRRTQSAAAVTVKRTHHNYARTTTTHKQAQGQSPPQTTNERENKPHHRALADTKDEILVQATRAPIGAEAIGKLRNIAH